MSSFSFFLCLCLFLSPLISAALSPGQVSVSWFSDTACTSLSSLPSDNPLISDVNTCSRFAVFERVDEWLKIESYGALANFKMFTDSNCSDLEFSQMMPCGVCMVGSFFIHSAQSFRFDCGSSQIPPNKRVVSELLTYADAECTLPLPPTSLYPSNHMQITSDACAPYTLAKSRRPDLNYFATALSCAPDGSTSFTIHNDADCKKRARSFIYGQNNECMNKTREYFSNLSSAPGFSAYKLACTLQDLIPSSAATYVHAHDIDR
jgi:hypothetical protein